MSSRQEEKEQRKQERLAREAAAAAAAKRKRLLQLIGGVVVACAIVAGGAFALAGGGGDNGVDNADLTAAAANAGCEYRSFPNYGQDHIDKEFTAADYKTNPATSGNHVPSGKEAQAGLYVAGNEPNVGAWVHTLEHGRILFQYRPGSKPNVVADLEKLFKEDVKGSGGAYHSVLMRNNTKMPYQVAAVAWRHYMVCKTYTPAVIPAFREFRTQLVDKAPELIP
jgi:Protein of unknown function (DUF3105)